VHEVGDVHPHGAEDAAVGLPEPEDLGEARILVHGARLQAAVRLHAAAVHVDADRQDVVGPADLHELRDVEDERDEPEDVRVERVRGDRAATRHERAVDEDLRADVHPLELDEDLAVRVARVDREVLAVPVGAARHRAAAALAVDERVGVIPRVRDGDLGPGRVVERRALGVRGVGADEKLQGGRAEVDVDAVGRRQHARVGALDDRRVALLDPAAAVAAVAVDRAAVRDRPVEGRPAAVDAAAVRGGGALRAAARDRADEEHRDARDDAPGETALHQRDLGDHSRRPSKERTSGGPREIGLKSRGSAARWCG
jgi:hypothetical protein